MNYQETVDYLFSQLPMFQRVGAAAYKADLYNTIALCEVLGNPQNNFKSIHVAGTNGKGSVSSTLASIYQECGFKTGLFTSPHLKDYRERIKINGATIPEDFVVDFVSKIKDTAEALSPSFFETTCAMAFAYFAQEKVDIAILEVGMGGRLDSTNVVTPELSIITSISKDHEQFLGNTVEEIAVEKGGIIKPNIPVVIGRNTQRVVQTLETIANSLDAPIHSVSEDAESFRTDLKGDYQFENMQTASLAINVLRKNGWNLPEENVHRGAMRVRENVGFQGRWETISNSPRVIVDVGHNIAGVKQVVSLLKKESFSNLHIVWGMVGDKDSENILSLLPNNAHYYWCKPNVPRGKDEEALQNEAQKFGLMGDIHPGVVEAIHAAKIFANPDDLIFVGGSVFVVAEVI